MVRRTTALAEKGVKRRPTKRKAKIAVKASCVARSRDDVDRGSACEPIAYT
jgi:hypothetical protein